MVRLLLAALMVTGCSAGDACDPFPDQACIALEVHGQGIASLDQLRVASEALHFNDRATPDPPHSFSLPVAVALLPAAGFSGDFDVLVRGLLGSDELGRDDVRGVLASPTSHTRVQAVLVAAPQPDLAGVDFAGVDFAAVDLAQKTVDLALPPGADLSGAPTFHLEMVPNFGGSTDGLNTVWGSGPNDVYAVGYKAKIIHSTGDGTWQEQTSNADTANDVFWGVFGTGPGDLWATVQNRAYHSTGNGMWQEQTVISRSGGTDFRAVTRLFAFPSKIYAAGTGGGAPVYFTSGNGSWAPQGSAATGLSMNGMWGSSATDLYVVGGDNSGPHLFHSTGDGTWTEQTTPSTKQFSAIFGVSKNDIYVATTTGQIFHSTGDGTWTAQNSPAMSIESLWASAADDLWAVGEDFPVGILHSTGDGNWSVVSKPANLGTSFFAGRAVFGFARDDVYVVGTNEGVLHFHK